MYHLPGTVDNNMFQDQVLLCASNLPENDYYYEPKHVREVKIQMLTSSCAISWKYILTYTSFLKNEQYENSNFNYSQAYDLGVYVGKVYRTIFTTSFPLLT